MGAKQGKFLRWSDGLPKRPGPGGILSQGQDPDSHPTERHPPPFPCSGSHTGMLSLCLFPLAGPQWRSWLVCGCITRPGLPAHGCAPLFLPRLYCDTPAFSLPCIAVTCSATSVCMTYDDMFLSNVSISPPIPGL